MNHSVTLTWIASTDTVDGYFIYRGTTAGGEAATALNATVVGATTYVDTAVPGPGTYFYVVKSSLGGVLSIASNEVSAVILPAPPTALVVTARS